MPDVVQYGPSLAPGAPPVPEVVVQHPEEVPHGRSWPQGKLAGGNHVLEGGEGGGWGGLRGGGGGGSG